MPHPSKPGPARWPLFALGLAAVCLANSQAGAADAPAAKSELHAFTNGDGQSFKGDILNVVSNDVILKREDGQQFRVKLDAFSDDDQQFVHEWMAKAATGRSGGPVRINASPTKTAMKKTVNDLATTSTWEASYNVVVKNLTAFTWPKLLVRYVVVKAQARPGQLPPNDTTKTYITGSPDFENVKPSDEIKFSVEKFPMKETSVNPKKPYANGAAKVSTDSILAFWVRVYDEDGRILYEWSSDPDVTKGEAWDTIWTRGRGRGRASGSGPPLRGTPRLPGR